MSSKSSPSPPQGPTVPAEEARFPRGYCRYFLTEQGLKGQRCGCVHFTLNKSIPSAGCVCGHQSCFHTDEPHLPEMAHLKNKVKALQLQIENGEKDKQDLIARLSGLEEFVDKSREEANIKIQESYANLSQAWNSMGEIQRQNQEQQHRSRRHDEQIGALQAEVRRLENRQLELNDADISLEERIEALEELEEPATPSRPRRPSERDATPTRTMGHDPAAFVRPYSMAPAIRSRKPPVAANETPGIWTTHISLLPDSTTPFPFERDTNAYMRCLSRGLHQVVVIHGHDAEAFHAAVNKAFASLLRGRPWMPLQAQLCNAKNLQGLPMLRQLDESMIHGRYDTEFLRRYCGVCDSNGKIDSLYIAMRFDTLSWHALRHAPIFMKGLEACWVFDVQLDHVSAFDDDDELLGEADRPSAGDLLPPTVSCNLKRAASEISRSNSFGAAGAAADLAMTMAATEGEGQSQPKVPRLVPNITEPRRRAERV